MILEKKYSLDLKKVEEFYRNILIQNGDSSLPLMCGLYDFSQLSTWLELHSIRD